MAHYAILNEDNVVMTIVAADLINGAEQVFLGHKIIPSTPENPASEGAMYDEETEKFILANEIETVETPVLESDTDTSE